VVSAALVGDNTILHAFIFLSNLINHIYK